MDVVLNRDAFLKGLQMVQNIVEPRQTLPILANVLLETDGETIRVSATDLEVGARVTVPARVATKGAITISARKLAEIVKELPAATLTLKVGENAAVTGIVPRKAVSEIQRALGAGEEVQLAITENQFVLQMPNFVMTARLIEGQFPNYEAVIPKGHPGKLALSRPALISALRRVSV